MTSSDHEALLAREKPNYDGAEPSGNSLHALSLLRLQEFTGDDRYRQRAVKLFRAFGEVLSRRPEALSEMFLALDFSLDTPKEVVIVTAGSRAQADPFLRELGRTFLPNRILVVASQGDLPSQTKIVPLLESKTARKGNPTAYVCESGMCALPTSDPKVFAQQIRKVKPLPAPTSAR